jgi:hypothetical protein
VKLAATPTAPEFLAMSEEEQAFLQEIATNLLTTLEEAERAVARSLAAQNLDQEEQLALWALLPAKVKTAIKRANAPPGTLCTICGLTGSHTRHCSIGGKFA